MHVAQIEVKKDNVDKVPENLPVMIIRPSKGWIPHDLKELWDYRDLIYFFSWRDIKLRYKQTALGFSWAIIQPFLAMVVFTLFFGNLAKVPSDGVPYPIFAYAALLPWTLFSEGMTRSTNSMVLNSNIIKKVYFPRLILPISGILSPIVDFVIAFTILVGMIIYYGIYPTMNVIWLPAFLLLAIITSLGIGIWLTALNAMYRDFQYIVPFLVQIWMYASPVVYSASIVPSKYQILYALNPMAGVIEGFRWAILGTEAPSIIILVSALISILLLVTGVLYFTHIEKTLSDVV